VRTPPAPVDWSHLQFPRKAVPLRLVLLPAADGLAGLDGQLFFGPDDGEDEVFGKLASERVGDADADHAGKRVRQIVGGALERGLAGAVGGGLRGAADQRGFAGGDNPARRDDSRLAIDLKAR